MTFPDKMDDAYYLIDDQLVKGPYSISDAKNFLNEEESLETSKFMGKICFDETSFGIWVLVKTLSSESLSNYRLSPYWIRVESAKEIFHKVGISIMCSLEDYQKITKQLPQLKTLLLLKGIDFSEAI